MTAAPGGRAPGPVEVAESPVPEITIVAERVGPGWGGAEGYLGELARWLESTGRSPEVVCRCFGGAAEGLRVVRLPGGRGPSGLRRLAAAAEGAARRGAVLAPLALPGATHLQLRTGLLEDVFRAEVETLPAWRRRLHRRVNALNRRRRLLLRWEAACLRGPGRPRLMVSSPQLRDALGRRYGVAPEGVEVARPGVDPDLFQPSDPPPAVGDRGVTFLFVARDFPLKGLTTALEALARVRGRGVEARLEVAGGGRAGSFRRRCRRLGVEGAVRFLGHLQRRELVAAYHRCHLLVHPTYHDACSRVALEAVACGRGVVLSRRDGACAWLREGQEARVLDRPGDAVALADLLEEVADPAVRRAMGRAAAARSPELAFPIHARRVAAWLAS